MLCKRHRDSGEKLKIEKKSERDAVELDMWEPWIWGAGVQEMGWGVSGSCQELSDWIQMEEVMLCDPGSGHKGHSRLTSSAVFQQQQSSSGILLLPANPPSLPVSVLPLFHRICFNSCDVTHAEKLWALGHSNVLISGLKGGQSWT